MHDQMDEAGCASLKAREALLGMTWLRRSGALLASCAAIVLSCLCASATAQASTLPQGFNEQTVFLGPDEADGRPLRPGRPRVRRREERPHQGLRLALGDTTPTDVRRPAHEHPQLLGPRPARPGAAPELPRRRPTSTCSTRYDAADRRHAAALGLLGATPTPARLRPARPPTAASSAARAVAADGAAGDVDDRHRAGARRGLVPAVSRATRSARVDFGADGALYVSGGDGASFNFVDYGQDGNPTSTRAAIRRRAAGTLTPPDRRGRRAARARTSRTTGDPRTSTARVLRVDPATGAALPDNPLVGERRRRTTTASSPTASATRSASRSARAPTRSGSATSAGTTGRRSTASPNPTASVENFGWPCYEGVGHAAGLRRSEPLDLREPVRDGPSQATDARSSPTTTPTRSSPAKTVPTGSSSITGLAFYPSGGYPTTYDGALFFADYSRNCIWAMPQGANGDPDPPSIVDLRGRRREPGRPRDRPGRRPLLRRHRRRARSTASATRPGTSRRSR